MALPAEPLPTPEKQLGSAYVAYIPIPMKNSEEEYHYEDEDDEYYDDEEEEESEYEYYEDDDEHEEELEYYEDDDSDEVIKRRHWNKRPPQRTVSESRKYRRKYQRPIRKKSSFRRRKTKNKQSKRKKSKKRNNNKSKNSVPFLVPLMMVPENDVQDEERFSDSRRFQRVRGYNNNNYYPRNRRRHHRYIPQNYHPRRRFQMNRRRRPPFGYNPPPPFPNLHRMPGPPYPGPAPRAPNKPLDQTRIHPSIHEEVYKLPPKEFESGEEEIIDHEDEEDEDKDKDRSVQSPTVIVVQQPAYNPYLNLLAGSTPQVERTRYYHHSK